ncbi:MAG: hypothetical protein H6Q61_1155, partial [Firmicutes bacterium]|nr:hypothetical protein [Bacillota bacterium]
MPTSNLLLGQPFDIIGIHYPVSPSIRLPSIYPHEFCLSRSLN